MRFDPALRLTGPLVCLLVSLPSAAARWLFLRRGKRRNCRCARTGGSHHIPWAQEIQRVLVGDPANAYSHWFGGNK